MKAQQAEIKRLHAVAREQQREIVSIHDLELIAKALRYAEVEIHNPGAGRASNYDILDLIDQAKEIAKRSIAAQSSN